MKFVKKEKHIWNDYYVVFHLLSITIHHYHYKSIVLNKYLEFTNDVKRKITKTERKKAMFIFLMRDKCDNRE